MMITCIPEQEAEGNADKKTDERASEKVNRADGDVVCVSWDIETGPLPDDELRKVLPEFESPLRPGEFRAADVKLGNLTDPEKIRAKIHGAAAAHAKDVRDYDANVEAARSEHFANFKAAAPLDATTGRVVAIGVGWVDGEVRKVAIIGGCERTVDDERQLLEDFWTDVVGYCFKRAVPMVGHNIHGFDLPFLVQRSWILGVQVPDGLLQGTGRKYWNPLFIDTMREWGLGATRTFVKLDVLAKAFGFEGKTDGECKGENFHEFWFSDDQAKYQMAVDYVTRDVQLPAQIAMAMGVV